MIQLILFLIYMILILAVIFFERKSPTEALFWVVVLICIPYLGAILYLIFGSTSAIRLTAMIRRRRLSDRIPIPVPQKLSVDEGSLSEEDREVVHFNEVYNKSRLTCYDDVRIYTTGEEHYRQLFTDIRNAKQCIFMEFYSIHHDSVGEKLIHALAEKAAEGVTVLVQCDFIANFSTPESMYAPLKKAGGKVIRVKPYLTHFRSHRKIVVIDHETAYIGGMNIGEKYADLDKVKTPWRDTQVRLTGACVQNLEDYFLTDWLCAVKRRDWEETARFVEMLRRPHYDTTQNLCQFIMGGVDNREESVKMCYLSLIRSAKKRIRIQSPYFIPDGSILDALKTAAASGVTIELMIPGIKASFFLDPVTTYYVGQLMEYGVRVYKYHGYIHAKTMVIDDEICCIGSVNMDMRSLLVDDEICGVFYPNEMVRRYNDQYDTDIRHCTEYDFEEFKLRSRKEKILEGIFLLFAPLM